MEKRKAKINRLERSLESESVTGDVMNQTWVKIKEYQDAGYGPMAIMYFLSSEDDKHSFSLTKNHYGYAITVS